MGIWWGLLVFLFVILVNSCLFERVEGFFEDVVGDNILRGIII